MKWLKSLFKPKVCYICKKKQRDMVNYKNDSGAAIKVCQLCVEYAERRALRKV